jgi:precorrin-2/cobalt-factor-2 C20-methyltransferase
MSFGTLYGIGIGPGSPDLITLRAVRILSEVRVVLAPRSPKNGESIALGIAGPHLNPAARVLHLEFPMTRERRVLEAAWAKAAEQTEEALRGGESAAFLTLGDPHIYSTFGYLTRALRERAAGIPVETVPGVTSFQAAAARAGFVLCEGGESLRILSGIADRASLEKELARPGGVVILKAYGKFPDIRAALEAAGRTENALLASRVGLKGEEIHEDLAEVHGTPPYLSLVLSRR